MEFSALSNLQIFIIIVVVLSLIIFLLVSNRSKNIPTDAEAFNNALKVLVNGEKDKAYHLLRGIISKDSNNIDAFLLLGDLVREKDVNQAIKIHQTVILRPHISQSKKKLSFINSLKNSKNTKPLTEDEKHLITLDRRTEQLIKYIF